MVGSTWPESSNRKVPRPGQHTALRGVLVFKAHRLLYHSTLGSRVKKKKTAITGMRNSDARSPSRLPENRSVLERHRETPALCPGKPPWRQPRGKWMVSLVNSHTNTTSKRWHLWEIDFRLDSRVGKAMVLGGTSPGDDGGAVVR